MRNDLSIKLIVEAIKALFGISVVAVVLAVNLQARDLIAPTHAWLFYLSMGSFIVNIGASILTYLIIIGHVIGLEDSTDNDELIAETPSVRWVSGVAILSFLLGVATFIGNVNWPD